MNGIYERRKKNYDDIDNLIMCILGREKNKRTKTTRKEEKTIRQDEGER